MSQKTIVGVVDDCTMYSKSINLHLRRLKDAEVHTFTTKTAGHDVLDWLETVPELDVLIVDILINGINGVEVAEKVLSKFPGCEIIILTGCDDHNKLYQRAEDLTNAKSSVSLLRKTDGRLATRVLPQVYVANRVNQRILANKKR